MVRMSLSLYLYLLFLIFFFEMCPHTLSLCPKASRGSNKAGVSDLKKAHFALGFQTSLSSSVDETILHKITNLETQVDEGGDSKFPMIWTDEYRDSTGLPCTAMTISPSTDEEIAASDGDNASKVICDEVGLQYEFVGCATDNTNATSRLRSFLKEKCNMKMDERCRSGHGKNQYTSADDRREGWENGGMKFYFKGSPSDITPKQTRVEPAEPQPDPEDDESDDESVTDESDDESVTVG